MIKITIIWFVTAAACYLIGVLIGYTLGKRAGEKNREPEEEFDAWPDEVEIQHVGYDSEQLGREK